MKSTQGLRNDHFGVGSQEQVLGGTECEQPHSQPKRNILRVCRIYLNPLFFTQLTFLPTFPQYSNFLIQKKSLARNRDVSLLNIA